LDPDETRLRLRRCRHGVMLYSPLDACVGVSLDRYGEFSEGEAAVFRQFVRPGMTVVEAGAHIGALTVPLARFAGPRGRVLAFEPQRVLFQMLCANLALNGIETVEAHWGALGRELGNIAVPRPDYRRPGDFGAVALGGEAGESVPLLALDAFDLPACHLIKADVEGMEDEVLAGAEATIRRHRPVLYLDNDRPAKSPALLRAILGLGYRAFWHTPPLFSPENFAGERENVFAGFVSGNLLCLHRDSPMRVEGGREVTDPDAPPPFGTAS